MTGRLDGQLFDSQPSHDWSFNDAKVGDLFERNVLFRFDDDALTYFEKFLRHFTRQRVEALVDEWHEQGR